MDLRDLRKRAEELLRKPYVDSDDALDLVEEFFERLSSEAKSRSYSEAARRGSWNIELLDEAVDEVIDAYGGSFKLLDLWESAWEAKVSRSDAKEVIVKLLDAVRFVEKHTSRTMRGRGGRHNRK